MKLLLGFLLWSFLFTQVPAAHAVGNASLLEQVKANPLADFLLKRFYPELENPKAQETKPPEDAKDDKKKQISDYDKELAQALAPKKPEDNNGFASHPGRDFIPQPQQQPPAFVPPKWVPPREREETSPYQPPPQGPERYISGGGTGRSSSSGSGSSSGASSHGGDAEIRRTGRPVTEPTQPAERPDKTRNPTPFPELPKYEHKETEWEKRLAALKQQKEEQWEKHRTEAEAANQKRLAEQVAQRKAEEDNLRAKAEKEAQEKAKVERDKKLKEILELAKALQEKGGDNKAAGKAMATLMRKWVSDYGLETKDGDSLDELRESIRTHQLSNEPELDQVLRARLYWATEILPKLENSRTSGLSPTGSLRREFVPASLNFVNGFVNSYRFGN